jgi:hypothetical protein
MEQRKKYKKLFLDDRRVPLDCGYTGKWFVARNPSEFIDYINEVKPEVVSFDHDLDKSHFVDTRSKTMEDYLTQIKFSNYLTGYDLLQVFLEKYGTEDCKILFHSNNPYGLLRMESLLKTYTNDRNYEEDFR